MKTVFTSGEHNDTIGGARSYYKSKEQKIDFVRDSVYIYSTKLIDAIGQIKCGWSDDYSNWVSVTNGVTNTYYYPTHAAMKFSVAPNNGTGVSYGTKVDDGDFEHMRILSNGNVGIGTTNPSEKLDVNGNAKITGNLTVNDAYVGEWSNFNSNAVFCNQALKGNHDDFAILQRPAGGTLINSKLGQSLDLRIDNDTKMSVLSDGNVDITNSLSVGGNITLPNLLSTPAINSYAADNYDNGLLFQSHLNSHAVYKWSSNGQRTVARIWHQPKRYDEVGSGAAGHHGSLNFSSSYTEVLSQTPSMSITSMGNVGIGTDDPQANLHVSSGKGANGNCTFILQADDDNNDENSNPQMVFRQDGSLDEAGIGIDNNTNRLAICSGASGGGIAFKTGTTNGTDLGANSIFQKTDERMRIDTNGNVGIGTTNPTEKLEVNGNTVMSMQGKEYDYLNYNNVRLNVVGDIMVGGDFGEGKIISKSNSGTEGIIFGNAHPDWITTNVKMKFNSFVEHMRIVWDTGNVGIGTTNPTEKLHVEGTTYINGACTATSFSGIGSGLTGTASGLTANIANNVNITLKSGGTYYLTMAGGEGAGNKDLGQDTALSYNASTHTLTAESFNATSDIRVKTNIQTIVSKTALDQINQLEPKSYQFYDNDTTHFGLIAQEAEQIIPEAVDSGGTKMIPSIGEICKLINGGKTIVLDAKTTKDMVPTTLEFDDLSGNKQSVGIESFEGDKYIHLKESIEKHLNNGLTVFVHGHEVQDFRSINYNTIVAVSIAATKELTKELGQTRAELNETRTELNETRAELGQTRTELNELKKLVEQLMNK